MSRAEQKTVRERRAQFVRAARAYADLDQADVAKALNISTQSVKRMERGARDVSDQELKTMAVLFDVPLGFLRDGFAGVLPSGRDLETAIIELREEMCARLDRIGAGIIASLQGQGRDISESADRYRAAVASLAEGFGPLIVDEAHDVGDREDEEGNGVHAAA